MVFILSVIANTGTTQKKEDTAKERQEEERYQKLDCLIRQQQMLRKETAKSFAARRLWIGLYTFCYREHGDYPEKGGYIPWHT